LDRRYSRHNWYCLTCKTSFLVEEKDGTPAACPECSGVSLFPLPQLTEYRDPPPTKAPGSEFEINC
jgi:DNA-directed RNA polymerase subunit RPC12/RpoP